MDPEGNLSHLAGFYGGGPGGDIFYGQAGDEGGNYIGAGAAQTYSTITAQMQGDPNWTQVGTDLNNGNEQTAAEDMDAKVQAMIRGLDLKTPPGNAAAGFIKLAAHASIWCYAAVGATGIAGAASISKYPTSKPIAIMAAVATATAVLKCEQAVVNPDADEVAAFDAMGHTINDAVQDIYNQLGLGPSWAVVRASSGPSVTPSASASSLGGSVTADWNLTNTGATVDWTKSAIDPITRHAINAV